MPLPSSSSTMPIVMRWTEFVRDGRRTWYLRALHPDASFWGYVHVRTTTMDENRSFDGQMDLAHNNQIRSIACSVDDRDNLFVDDEKTDGIFGFGAPSDFEPVLYFNYDAETTKNKELFTVIVGILQPIVTSAANLPEN